LNSAEIIQILVLGPLSAHRPLGAHQTDAARNVPCFGDILDVSHLHALRLLVFLALTTRRTLDPSPAAASALSSMLLTSPTAPLALIVPVPLTSFFKGIPIDTVHSSGLFTIPACALISGYSLLEGC
jgi:hypothetical protein